MNDLKAPIFLLPPTVFFRTDDNEESLRKRVDTYNNQTFPIIEHYKKLGLVREVTSNRPPEKVHFNLSWQCSE